MYDLTVVSLKQFAKADRPIEVTPDGMVIEVRPECWKAPKPMLVTLEGIVTEVRLTQEPKVLSSMLVTPSGMLISVKLLQP